MHRIVQEDPTGCGLACVAMLSNTTYKKVRKAALEIDLLKGRTLYTSAKDLHNLAKKFDLSLGQRRRKFKSFDALPDTAILAINYRPKTGSWHWVVYHRNSKDEYVIDPMRTVKTDKRKDFKRLQNKTKWWVEVNYK